MKTFLLIVFALFETTLAWASTYSCTLLSPPYPYTSPNPSGINNNGDIVGTATSQYRSRAFRYTAAGSVYIIDPLNYGSYYSSYGLGINKDGIVVGYCTGENAEIDAKKTQLYALWDAPGQLPSHDPGATVNNVIDSIDLAVTDNKYAIVANATGPWSLWAISTGIEYPIPFGIQPIGLNDSLMMIANTANLGGVIYNWKANKIISVGYLDGLDDGYVQVGAINKLSTIAGTITNTIYGNQGYILTNAHLITRFGSNIASVRALNSAEDVVGTFANGHAFVYVKSKKYLIDLNNNIVPSLAPKWTVVTATGINDHGQICGQVRRFPTSGETTVDGYVYAGYKLTPNPDFPPGGIISPPTPYPGAQ